MMRTISMAMILALLLGRATVLQASQADELRDKANKFQKAAAALADIGRTEAADQLKREAQAIIRELLARHRISVYEIEAIPEGKELPGSSYPDELESMSGYITTPTSVYEFWFDWQDDHYTLGEEDGSWQEVHDETEREAKITREIQRRLREKLVNSQAS